jgi:phosphonate transport system substrate-binding protein
MSNAEASASRLARRRAAAISALLAPAMLAAAGTARAQRTDSALVIGVVPNVSARLILAAYQPMRMHLERELGRRVEVATAPDFRGFAERALRGEYRVIVTAPNVGRVLQMDAGWEPIAIYEPQIPAILVAGADNPLDAASQLRGRALALANPQSLVALVGLQWLRNQGLQAGTDFSIALAANDDSLGAVLRSGEAPLAVMSMGEFRAKPEEMRKRLRIVTEIARVPGFLVMTAAGMDDTERRRLRGLLLAFPKTDEGRQFLGLSGFSGIREVADADLRFLDPYVEPTRRGLGLAR